MSPTEPDHHHLVGFNIEWLPGVKDDQRTVESPDQLTASPGGSTTSAPDSWLSTPPRVNMFLFVVVAQ
jgi:hypothetical protein